MNTSNKIDIPAPQAKVSVEKYGMELKTAITLSGKTQVIAVVGGGVETPTKNPFKKLKIQFKGVKSTPTRDEILENT
ncbi:hypothetical protein KW786_02050 [Candidatus Parcubacteria bacterium]|nr:hypothetical protein [Candidatus Parcubacteria bacterium]